MLRVPVCRGDRHDGEREPSWEVSCGCVRRFSAPGSVKNARGRYRITRCTVRPGTVDEEAMTRVTRDFVHIARQPSPILRSDRRCWESEMTGGVVTCLKGSLRRGAMEENSLPCTAGIQ